MMKLTRILAVALFAALPLVAQPATAPAAETWTLDKSHSSIEFRVRHLMANVTGTFNTIDGRMNVDQANPANSSIEFTIQAASIDTRNEKRDEHLRSADFFETEKYPTITFKSTSMKAESKTEYAVTGDLTMHGVTKRITIPVTFLGFGKDRGTAKAGFELETKINRKDFGIEWNRALDEGGVVLGDDVRVFASLQFAKK